MFVKKFTGLYKLFKGIGVLLTLLLYHEEFYEL